MSGGPCRSCSALLLWATTGKGRQMPLNPEPDPGGNVKVTLSFGVRYAAVLSGQALADARLEGMSLFLPHFASCPAADRHRNRRTGGRR